MDINLKIGERIRDLRLEKNLSQEALAFKAEVNRTYMQGVESGKRNVSVKVLEKIITALDSSYKTFFNHQNFEK